MKSLFLIKRKKKEKGYSKESCGSSVQLMFTKKGYHIQQKDAMEYESNCQMEALV